MSKYALGADFGTESVRVLLVDVETGEEAANAVAEYRHGVISEKLPTSGEDLPPDWALQYPLDYLESMESAVKEALKLSGIKPDEIIGMGVDFTSCTILPTTADGKPLCLDERFRTNPHAWVKLWKHHGAHREADEINELARKRKERFLDYYGGAISSEWLLPKALQMLREAEEVFRSADRIIEGGDWIVWRLTGNETRNTCALGYKALLVEGLGFPSREFLSILHPELPKLYVEKIRGPHLSAGERAGRLRGEVAERLGLKEGIPVSAGIIDAHSGVPGSGIATPNKMLIVLGTSFCHMLLHTEAVLFKGAAGIVKDGILKGYYGYESGQTAGGDIFSWFVRTLAPSEFVEGARRMGKSLYEVPEDRARALKPGSSGLLCLDWWNGNRSILMDANLTGMIMGLTLGTKPEEIYRCLLEGTAFGTRRIVESYIEAGIPVESVYACGGLPRQSPLFMQILTDILNREVRVASSEQTVALGSAIFGAVCAGKKSGGYDSVEEAVEKMVNPALVLYQPSSSASVYERLYQIYRRMYDYFGLEEPAMHELREVMFSVDSVAE